MNNKLQNKKRSDERYLIELPVEFSVSCGKSRHKIKIRTISKDLSEKGFSFMASYFFEKPIKVEFVFKLPDLKRPKTIIEYKVRGKIAWYQKWCKSVIYKTGIYLLKDSDRKVMAKIIEHARKLKRD